MHQCICGSKVKNGAQNRSQHRRNCVKYQQYLAVKQQIEPRAVGKRQRKSEFFVTLSFFLWGSNQIYFYFTKSKIVFTRRFL